MAQGAHAESRGIQGSRDLQAPCKAISVSRTLSRSPAFPRCLNPTALSAWDGFLGLGQRDSAAAVPPAPREEALLVLQLVLQPHGGAEKGRMGWLPLCIIPLRGGSTPGCHGGCWQWDVELLPWLTPQASRVVIFTGSRTRILHSSNKKSSCSKAE